MSKIIFYTDTHNGPVLRPQSANSVHILGPKALPIQAVINHYASEQGIRHLIHGGDVASKILNITKENYEQNFLNMMDAINQFDGSVTLGVGNHDDQKFFEEFDFTPTQMQTISNDNFVLLVNQMYETPVDGKNIFSNDTTALAKIFNHHSFAQTINNRILLSLAHAAYDRKFIGYPEFYPSNKGYAYQQNSDLITTNLGEIERANPQTVLSLHGHEHRFRLTTSADGFGFTCLTMPSIVQALPNDPDTPCGLFVEIDRHPHTGKISYEFRQITLNETSPENSTVATVSLDYMNKNFFRPFVPKPV